MANLVFKLTTCQFLGAFAITSILFTSVPATADDEATFLSNTRQLTFEGRRAGEGYFSADGSLMVFQSERDAANPFFQIYLMDRETGDVSRVSPGFGKTTCAWIRPDNQRVLFASTHGDPKSRELQREELEFRASGKERRYSWDYDPEFEIYEYDLNTKQNIALTDAQGYDAEGSYSPDGKLIAFASNRAAYSEAMSPGQQEAFKLDPAVMNDIYIMNADGSNVKRLTETLGYDGGPFFSPDGTRICWRRFAENGATAEIMTMKIDGTDKRQLTRIGAMSWAPIYHPSGEYLIFATNIHGFDNFELYIVDVNGEREPVRATYTGGFDGLPAFTPDGNQLAWTSNRTSSKQSQIFIADWDHAAAREALGITENAPPSDTVEATAVEAANLAVRESLAAFSPADMMRHVDYLCRPELAGRMTGSQGEQLATAYVAAVFDHLGLQPLGDEGSWFQGFNFTAGVDLGDHNSLLAGDGKSYQVGTDWQPLAFSKTGDIPASEVVFAGYGIVAPQDGELAEYDSYVHLDVTDKWVLAFRFMPDGISPEMRQHLGGHSSLRYKAMVARDRGARGLIVVSGPQSKVKNQLVKLQFDGTMAGASIPVLSVTDEVANRWLQAAGKDMAALQAKLDTGEPQMGFSIENLKLQANIEIRKVKRSGRNVVGRLQAGDVPSKESIMVCAHIDHLGAGANSSSLAREDEKDMIHFGADDNASGIAAMLEVAEYLADQKRNGKLSLKRDVIFAAWSGEELGLIGSNHFANALSQAIAVQSHAHSPHAHPHSVPAKSENPHAANPHAVNPHAANPHATNPHAANPHAANPHATNPHVADPHNVKHAVDAKSTTTEGHTASSKQAANPHSASPEAHHQPATPGSLYPTISACLNMDMVGRFEKRLVLQGVGSSSIWKGEIERRNAPIGLPITLQNDSYLPTDASTFFMRGVPILSAFTGSHSDYHTPRDTPDKLNYEAAAKIARFMGLVARSLTIREDAPDYVAQAGPEKGQRRARLRAYLGTIPDYAESDVQGLKLSGVAKNGPAAKGGLQAGDVIIELAGKKIDNIYDYTYAIEALKIGQGVKIVVQRGEKKLTLEVTPGSRD